LSLPLLGGWGGVRLSETQNFFSEINRNPRNVPLSEVFEGEVASDAELVFKSVKDQGFNAVRAYFRPPYDDGGFNGTWWFRDDWFQRVLNIAEHFDMWLIIDCHSGDTSVANKAEWLFLWDSIIRNYGDRQKLVWQPLNEPTLGLGIDALTLAYQDWINQCRALNDTHWIVIKNSGEAGVHPILNDPLNKLVLDMHFYFMFQWEPIWTEEEALARADAYYRDFSDRAKTYGRPIICTEMGAGLGLQMSPDAIDPFASRNPGECYSPITAAFIQRLIDHFDSSPRTGYFLWHGGDWSTGALFGYMDTWGELLTHKTFALPPTPIPKSLPLILGAVAATGIVIYAATRKNRSKRKK